MKPLMLHQETRWIFVVIFNPKCNDLGRHGTPKFATGPQSSPKVVNGRHEHSKSYFFRSSKVARVSTGRQDSPGDPEQFPNFFRVANGRQRSSGHLGCILDSLALGHFLIPGLFRVAGIKLGTPCTSEVSDMWGPPRDHLVAKGCQDLLWNLIITALMLMISCRLPPT